MNLNGAIDEVQLPVSGDEVYVQNSWTDSVPAVVRGNGPAKVNILPLHHLFQPRAILFSEKLDLLEQLHCSGVVDYHWLRAVQGGSVRRDQDRKRKPASARIALTNPLSLAADGLADGLHSPVHRISHAFSAGVLREDHENHLSETTSGNSDSQSRTVDAREPGQTLHELHSHRLPITKR